MNSRPEPEGKTEAEIAEEHSLVARLSLFVLPSLLYGSEPPAQGGTTHSGLDPLLQLAIKKMTPDTSTGSCDGGNSSVEIPSCLSMWQPGSGITEGVWREMISSSLDLLSRT